MEKIRKSRTEMGKKMVEKEIVLFISHKEWVIL